MKKIGIFPQYNEIENRIYNRLCVDYVEKVEAAGAFAMIIPAFSLHRDKYLDECDAFIFSGGPDIDPSLYGEKMAGAINTTKKYDEYLLSAIKKIGEMRKPILGICKGMQLLNVAHGGTLKQHIHEALTHQQPHRPYDIIHLVDIKGEESFLWKVEKRETMEVNSIHHQAVKVLGKDLRVSAESILDKEIEAIEHASLPHYGVQWHPEHLKEKALFQWFVSL